jgi:hypothetical protein
MKKIMLQAIEPVARYTGTSPSTQWATSNPGNTTKLDARKIAQLRAARIRKRPAVDCLQRSGSKYPRRSHARPNILAENHLKNVWILVRNVSPPEHSKVRSAVRSPV